MGSVFVINRSIDTSGTRCPIPLLKAKKALKDMQTGQCLEVLATDPSAKSDFEAMLAHLPHDLLDYSSVTLENADHTRVDSFIIRKG